MHVTKAGGSLLLRASMSYVIGGQLPSSFVLILESSTSFLPVYSLLMTSKCKIILIADTHKDLVTFYSSYLEKHFDIHLLYKINKASLKKEIKAIAPDLVIVDTEMNTMIDLVQEIAKEYSMPICIYSDEFVSSSQISSRPHGIEIFNNYGQNVKALHKSEIKPEDLSRELDKIIKGAI